MYPHLFSYLEQQVTPLIAKQNTRFRPSISPGERLAVTIRFLATGETYRSLAFQFRLGETTIGKIVPETCDALYEVLKGKYFKVRKTMIQLTISILNSWFTIESRSYV
ncbi:hypothetical protein HOLleu_11140 [Holothuria leucospilota]|uniref:Uncharacterized protein n=1 Tax=Holothuria leucospilota TaxID=206669 RepID=A0A9Q1CEI1_HOLLE|nr:hypothetical protein HOLleu_11140 [Holothuria leucospilota]